MTEPWATFGRDLHLELAGRRVRAGLEDALRDAVRTGRLHPGTPLPSSRALAGDLGIARNTVADAYGQLVAEGWLTAQRGSSTRVTDRVVTSDAADPPGEPVTGTPRFDLRPGSPDLSSFPRPGWLAAARRALNTAPDEALGYTDPRGRPELRRALAEYLSRARGVRATSDHIVVCSGFTQGFALLAQVLGGRGAVTMATEAYGQPSHRALASAAGLAIKPLPVDASGAAISELGDADAVLLTPAHQFPIGVTLAAPRRTAAIAWAQHHARLIVEDDYDGEFRYDRQPVGAMQALAPEHVVYVGTASKTLAPGLRLGWLVVPTHLIDEIVAVKTLADRQTSALDQLTMAEFITQGAYDRHVRRSRLAYRRRRDRLVAELQHQVPSVRVTGIAAGLHALLELPEGRTEDEIVARASRRHGLAIEGLASYRSTGQEHGPALVVGYGTPPPHALTGAIARLCAVLADRPSG